MPNQVAAETKRQRQDEVAPFFDHMRAYGMTLSSVARKLAISPARMHAYREGINATPAWIIRDGYKAIGSPRRLAPFVKSYLQLHPSTTVPRKILKNSA